LTDFKYQIHKDDPGIDAIVIKGKNGDTMDLRIVPRWKSSYLSGDEWRYSWVWYFKGEPLFDRGFTNPTIACAAIYTLATGENTIDVASDYVVRVSFIRRGEVRHVLGFTEGSKKPWLSVMGELPWSLLIASEDYAGPGLWSADHLASRNLCFQPGCTSEAVNTYRMKMLYDYSGNGKPANDYSGLPLHRMFCHAHSVRGDCGLEDSDSNYEIVANHIR
jgi:hypothetical protein